MSRQVLLIDDDVELVHLLSDYLHQEGFVVAVAHDGEAGIAAALSTSHDIVVLDIMMPGISGIEVLKHIRKQSTIPVIMLTARGDDADRITGLELGADDYVAKPCTPRELTARIRAILRRLGATPLTMNIPVIAGPLTLYSAQRCIKKMGVQLHLTSTEFNLLELLIRHAGQPVSKAELSLQCIGRPLTPFDRIVDVHISSIRYKVGILDDGRSMIKTVIRRGYQLLVE